MQLNEIFRIDQYDEACNFCAKNNLTIKRIESDEYGRRFQIVEKQKPTREQVLNDLRYMREDYCFPVINRGVLWYNTLTEEQRLELDKWYKAWLDVTDRYVEGIDIETIIPTRPTWLK